MTEKCAPREEGNVETKSAEEASNNDEEYSESSDSTAQKTARIHDNLAGIKRKGEGGN